MRIGGYTEYQLPRAIGPLTLRPSREVDHRGEQHRRQAGSGSRRVYARFTHGFDTADRRDARAVLEENDPRQ